ncbi:MAG TPA: AraC family transcriptional regulator [Polyangiaceae bacterium]
MRSIPDARGVAGLDIGGCESRPHATEAEFRDALVEHIARAFGSSTEGTYPGGRLYAESLGLALASHLVGSSSAPPRALRSLSKAQRARVLEYIEAHLDKDLSLPRLAGVAGVSLSHFKVLFKRCTGLPVHEYAVRRRVEARA